MVKVHRPKYFDLYQQMAMSSAQQSVAEKRQVGCVIVTTQGMIAPGWNGTPPGFPNQCEQVLGGQLVTDPCVIHAESNALDKLAREGVSAQGALVFVTTAPCIQCAKRLLGAGVSAVRYQQPYSSEEGVRLLRKAGIPCDPW